MISGEKKDRDSRLVKATHRASEVKACAHVFPVAIEQITRNNNKVHSLSQGLVNQVVKGGPSRQRLVSK